MELYGRKDNRDYHMLPDKELVTRLKADDHAAFNEIVNRYNALLIKFSYRRVGDLQVAEDMAHDTLAYLWEKRENLECNKCLAAYIFGGTKNQVISYFRRKQVSQRYVDNFQRFLSQEDNTCDYLIRHNDLSALIDREIASLPPKMRQVFELNRLKHMSRREIAECLGIPENTVKTNMHRALKILKQRFASVN